MRKLLYIIVPLLLAACSSGKQAEDEQSESQFVRDAKSALVDELEQTFKKGVRPENERILYVNEQDSICVIGFDLNVKRASGRVVSGECEYIYYPRPEDSPFRKLSSYVDGWILYMDQDQSIIERAKDFADEVELDMAPEDRYRAKSWEDMMEYVVDLSYLDNSGKRLNLNQY